MYRVAKKDPRKSSAHTQKLLVTMLRPSKNIYLLTLSLSQQSFPSNFQKYNHGWCKEMVCFTFLCGMMILEYTFILSCDLTEIVAPKNQHCKNTSIHHTYLLTLFINIDSWRLLCATILPFFIQK